MNEYCNLIARILFSVILYSILPFYLYGTDDFFEGKDHGELSEKHIQVSRDFVFQTFKSEDGGYDPEKIQLFLDKLIKESEALATLTQETKIIEDIELDVKKPKKSRKKAKKKYTLNQHNLVQAYSLYLIPTIEELLNISKKNNRDPTCDHLVDNFIRGYNLFFIPNAKRTRWPFDVDLLYSVKRLFKPYKYKHEKSSYVEASNLVIDSSTIDDVRQCLGKPIRHGAYLSPAEIVSLSECQYDLSKLNPGVSGLWTRMVDQRRSTIHDADKNNFPHEDEKVTFKGIIHRGQGSPKFKVFYQRDGIRKELKLKVGWEIHADKAVSKIMELAGMNQDQMLHRDSVKLYLGKYSYEEFRSLLANKYGIQHTHRFIWGHGGEGKNQWVLLKDVLYESRPENEVRLSSFDITSWDLQNRREFRSLVLLWGWLGLNDTKTSNFKVIYRKSTNGKIRPLFRFQDTGVSLGGELNLRKVKNLLSLGKYYRVNAFPETFLKKKGSHKVSIYWNDFANHRERFQSTTWSDLRWMARIIGNINPDDIHRSLTDSGMPAEVAYLYYIKLLSRRNEIIRSFQLENEIPIYDLPNLEDINMKDSDDKYIVKKGKLKKSAFKDKNNMNLVQEKWLTLFPKLLNFDIPVYKWGEKDQDQYSSVELNPQGNISHNYFEKLKRKKSLMTLPLGVGTQAVLSRKVIINDNIVNIKEKNLLYTIEDRIKIQLGLESPLIQKILSSFKIIKLKAYLKILEIEYSHIHYADSLKEAYLQSFNLIKIIRDPKSYANSKLQSMESIKSHVFLGLDVKNELNVSWKVPQVNNELSLQLGNKKIITHHYVRDSVGRLHIIEDQLKDHDFGFGLNLAEFDFYEAAASLFKSKLRRKSFKYSYKDISLENRDEKRGWDQEESNKEERDELLNKEKRGHSPRQIEQYSVKSVGKKSILDFGFLYFFNKGKETTQSDTYIERNLGKNEHFFFYKMNRNKSHGINQLKFDYGQSDVMLKNRKRSEVIAEVDVNNRDNFILTINIEDFYRVRKSEKLIRLINDLNRRYSFSKDRSFYDFTLFPNQEWVAKYPKVYGMTRVFVNANELLTQIKLLNKNQLKIFVDQHFNSIDAKEKGCFRKLKETRYRRKVIQRIKKIKRALDSQDFSYKSLAIQSSKLVNSLRIESYGIHFLKKVIGEKQMFVMSDIAGVLRSFSTIQTLQQQQKVRFAASSWGKLNIVSPIQYFLRYHRYIPASIYVQKNISDTEVLGYLNTSVANNIKYTFDMNHQF